MYLGEDLILVLSPPRSGSTMLQRILGSHSEVQTHPEPHILTPLAFQGVYHQVDSARYNHRVAAQALREFVDFLPRKEDDYLDACREYCRVLYGRARDVNGKRFFLDKTPNYADTILPFIARLLPKARFIVLTRHPLALLSSDAHTFHQGNYDRAHYSRDVIGTFVPAIAAFLREPPVPLIHVRYEDLVTDPQAQVHRLLDFVGLPFEPGCIDFGEKKHINKTYGDPKIEQHSRPVASSVDTWVKDLIQVPARERLCRQIVAGVPARDLATFGFPAETLWQPLQQARAAGGVAPEAPGFAGRWHEWKWDAVRGFQRAVRRPAFRPFLQRLARQCDRLLRVQVPSGDRGGR